MTDTGFFFLFCVQMPILSSAFIGLTNQICHIAGLYHGLLLVAITIVSRSMINQGVILGKPHKTMKSIMFMFISDFIDLVLLYDTARLRMQMELFHRHGQVMEMLMLLKKRVIKQCLLIALLLVCFLGILTCSFSYYEFVILLKFSQLFEIFFFWEKN